MFETHALVTTMSEHQILQRFSEADSVRDVWSAARELMAQRLLSRIVDTPFFLKGFDRLPTLGLGRSDVDHFLALDLLVRLSAASKKLTVRSENHLRKQLIEELPPLQILNNTSTLPDHAKPADIRENIAIALRFASGEWTTGYLINSAIEEKQSQRTREVLVRELMVRMNDLGDLLHCLTLGFKERSDSDDRIKDGHIDLQSICLSIANVISQNRQIIAIDPSTPEKLDILAGVLVKYSTQNGILVKLTESAAALIRLLDELLTSQMELFVEYESYFPIGRVSLWWTPRSYPEEVRLALKPVIEKLVSAISIRAKMGQKSEELLRCLRYAVQDLERVAQIRNDIADKETLTADIDDWLRGKERLRTNRSNALRRALQGVGQDEVDQLVGDLLISIDTLKCSLELDDIENSVNIVIDMKNRVHSAALQRRLVIEGTPGDVVDYTPEIHTTRNMLAPLGHKVKLEKPALVRIRDDGTRVVIAKAIVNGIGN